MLFKDRHEAGKKLATKLAVWVKANDSLILALPRGGVVLGYEISKALHIPLDIILVRKLGVPGQEELALGAIAMNNIRIINKSIISNLDIDEADIERISTKEQLELNRRNILYRQAKPFPVIKNKTVLLVDDGIATGATMRAAIKVVETMQPNKIIVAAPVASTSVYKDFHQEHVELCILETPEPFFGIGMWYQSFPQVTDQEVINFLNASD